MFTIARLISEDQINGCRILVVFVLCWFFNRSFKIIQSIKIFRNVITHCNIEVTNVYKVNKKFCYIYNRQDSSSFSHSKVCFYANCESH